MTSRRPVSSTCFGMPAEAIGQCWIGIDPDCPVAANQACGWEEGPDSGRGRGRCMTLIRHAPFEGALSIGPLPQSVRLLACFRTLVPGIGRTRLPSTGSFATSIATVALPSVATDTDKEHNATIPTTAPAHSESTSLRNRLLLRIVHGNTILQSPGGSTDDCACGADDIEQLYAATGHFSTPSDGR
jgi:hypothetical protein